MGKRSEQTTHQRRYIQKHVQRCSILYAIREMQIKPTQNYRKFIRMAKIQNSDSTEFWPGCGEQSIIAGGKEKCNSHFERQCSSLLQVKHRHTVPSSHCPLWYLPSCPENFYLHRNLHINIYDCHIPRHQELGATKVAFNRLTDEQTLIHPHYGILFSYQKK